MLKRNIQIKTKIELSKDKRDVCIIKRKLKNKTIKNIRQELRKEKNCDNYFKGENVKQYENFKDQRKLKK